MKIAAVILLVVGAAVVYGAGVINRYVRLDRKMKIPEGFVFENEEEREKFLRQKALAVIKVFGLIFIIPGIILVFITFR